MKEATFFKILIDGDAKAWARRMWDTYGFDYDTERSYGGVLYAWAYGASDEELAEALRTDGIEFTTFLADTTAWFGLPQGLPPS